MNSDSSFSLKFITYLLLISLFLSYFNARGFAQARYIDMYDGLYESLVVQRYKALDTTNKKKSNIYGDGMSYVMVADLIMYETLGNEKYLERYLANSAAILSYRKDIIDTNGVPRWSNHPSMYQDGLILWSYAYFIDAVKVRRTIDSSFQIPDLASCFLSLFNVNPKTIEELIPLYYEEIVKTLDYYEQFWYGPKFGLKIFAEKGARPAYLNFQSAFATTYYYLGNSMHNDEYLTKAHQFAKLYRSIVKDKPNCVFGTPIRPYSRRSVLELTEDSCLVFRHWGWRPSRCKRDFAANGYDDISHGIQSLIFPMSVVNRFKSEEDLYYFSDEDMIFLHNTFTKRIFAGYKGACPQFNNTIIGDSTVQFDAKLTGFNDLAIRSISYSFLIPYDDHVRTSHVKINKIIHDFLELDCFSQKAHTLAGMDLFGLAMYIREINTNESLKI
ncbi:MAG: hypothetical protein RBS19_11980 [Bacteroidales bacterium]|nr:hypothetical protein [Bacteroidales bacterium]MDY0217663.1 hypothetical protein [Bacteroidales bacterium]